MAIEVLGEHGVLAVRHAVLSQIPSLHVRGDDLEVATRKPTAAAAAESKAHCLRLLVPFGSGIALPRALPAWRPACEMKQPRLLASICLEFQCVVVLPGNL